jgi:hypothetical protein
MEEKINNEIKEIEDRIEYHKKMIQIKADENLEKADMLRRITNVDIIKILKENITKNEREQEKYNTEIMLLNGKITELKESIERYKNYLTSQAEYSKIPSIRIGVHNIRIIHLTDKSITIESNYSTTMSISTIPFNECKRSALSYAVSNLTNRPIITKEMCNQLFELYHEQETPISC